MMVSMQQTITNSTDENKARIQNLISYAFIKSVNTTTNTTGSGGGRPVTSSDQNAWDTTQNNENITYNTIKDFMVNITSNTR